MNTFPIIEKLGGRERVFELLTERTSKWHTSDAIRMWEARRSIPGDGIRHLMQIAADKGLAIQPNDFFPDLEQAS